MTESVKAAIVGIAILMAAPLPLFAGDPAACKTVKLAEVGWTDVTLTTNVASELLKSIGYDPQITLLSLDITLKSLENKDVDVFLGDWRPSVDAYSKPYLDRQAVERLVTNLGGAKFTLAVPKYVADGGVTNFADLAKFGDKFSKTIYGIDPGNNESSLKMVAENKFGLGDWTVQETAEAAMLAQVQRAYGRKEWIVFQAWAPHPMNTRFDLVYLAGGDDVFGKNFGEASVSTMVRKGYAAECPNLGRFLTQLQFDVAFENRGMTLIADDGMDGTQAAAKMINENPELISKWLQGVKTIQGEDAVVTAKAKFRP